MFKEKIKSLKVRAGLISLVAAALFALISPITAFAASGDWTSVTAADFNGLSETGTVNRAATTTFTIGVKYTDNGLVGSKITTISKGGTEYHQCWGVPFRDKHGFVNTRSKSHDPWFDA